MRSISKLLRWYFSRAALPYWAILILDCILVFVAGLLSYFLHHGAPTSPDLIFGIICTLAIFLICFMVGFRMFHTYFGVIRFSSFIDLMRITMAVLIGVTLVFILQWLIEPSEWFIAFSVVDVIMFAVLAILLLWAVRVWGKTMFDGFIRSNVRLKAYVLGTKNGATAIADTLNSSETSSYMVTGFVSDDPHLKDLVVNGIHVHMLDRHLADIMLNKNVLTLIVSPMQMDTLHKHSELFEYLAEQGIRILVVPDAREWDGESDISVENLKPVDVEDLLPREEIVVDMNAAAQLITGNVVMITGAAGSIGSEMVRQIATYSPAHLVLVDQAETPMHDIRRMMQARWPEIESETIVADISDARMMERIFNRYKPEYVFHAAAYKHVPMMEDNPYESVVNNILGTKIIADLSVKYGARKFVMVSTDKAVNPTNVMGCSKRICEIYVQSLDKAIKERAVKGVTRFVTTRFGNVLGSNGSVIPIFQEQIRKGGPVTVTHPDIMRYFMLIPEACKLVIEAGTMGNGGEIYVFDMGEPVKIAELAKRMIRLSGAKNVEIVYSGLRDGEKLYEEVLNDKETTVPTFHPKIKAAKVREYEFDDINSEIDELINNAATDDDMRIVARMKRIVPEYKSQHSPYEVLDK